MSRDFYERTATDWLSRKDAAEQVSDRYSKPVDFTSGIKMTGNEGIVASNSILHNDVIKALAAGVARA